jgi:glucokinase
MNRFDTELPAYGIAVDMGATHLRFVLANSQSEILEETRDRVLTEAGLGGVIAQIRDSITRLLPRNAGRERFRGIALGVPSAVDPRTGRVLDANNVPGWRDIDLGVELERIFQVPVYVDNDANMAAIGEHWRGVARDVENFVFVALGTGVGAGIFVNGNICRGRTGSAGEIYRMNLDWRQWKQDFPDTGYFETFVSGMGLATEGRKTLSSGNGAGATDIVDGRDARFVFDAAAGGDPQARQLIERCFEMLGVGVANLISVLDPELIVFNGGLVRGAPEQLLATVERVVRRIHPNPPPIRLSALGDQAQIWGALCTLLYPNRQRVIRAVEPAAGD